MNFELINQSLTVFPNAKKEFNSLCEEMDNKVMALDKHNLLLPAYISTRRWMMFFYLAPEFKKALWKKYSPEAKSGNLKLDYLRRGELEDYIIENELDIDPADYCDEPLEALVDAIKDEERLLNLDDEDKDVDDLNCMFEHIGLYAWVPSCSKNAVISLYIEMDGDDATWPLTKRAAQAVDGDILLHSNKWDNNQIKVMSFSLDEEINLEAISKEIVNVAEQVWKMAQ